MCDKVLKNEDYFFVHKKLLGCRVNPVLSWADAAVQRWIRLQMT